MGKHHKKHHYVKKARGRGLFDMAKKGISSALAASAQYGIANKLANSSNPKLALAGKLLGMADGTKTGKPRRRMKRGGSRELPTRAELNMQKAIDARNAARGAAIAAASQGTNPY